MVKRGDNYETSTPDDLHGDLKPAVDVGKGPYGQRTILDVTGGTFEGEKLRGTLLPSGGDWILVDDLGAGHLDVRITLQTDDPLSLTDGAPSRCLSPLFNAPGVARWRYLKVTSAGSHSFTDSVASMTASNLLH